MEEVDSGWRKHFASTLRVCRTGYYRVAVAQQRKDEASIAALIVAHQEHPFYGVARLAIHLGWSEVKTRRIRNLAGTVIPTSSQKHRLRKNLIAEISAPSNALGRYANFKDATKPANGLSYGAMVNVNAWVQDFTYLKFQKAWYYLAVVLDLRTRRVVGWRLGASHSSQLTFEALLDALSKHSPPAILHSDQGSEYLSYKHQELCNKMEIVLSCSAKSSPWQNGFMERWFGGFKPELGKLNKFKDIPQLLEAVALQIHYYNTKRIHTALRMSPAAYAASLKQNKTKTTGASAAGCSVI